MTGPPRGRSRRGADGGTWYVVSALLPEAVFSER
jgi:hypothetical protein